MPKSGRSLLDLEMHTDFIPRHIGPDEDQIDQMLAALELQSLDELVEDVAHFWVAVGDSAINLTQRRLDERSQGGKG